MAQHDVKVDSMAKVVTAIGVVLLVIVVVYMAKSLMNTVERGSTKGEVATAPSAPAAQAPAAAPATASAAAGDVEAGKAKYATCAACHGANGEGAGSFPKLAGQSAADIEGKLKKYRAGEQVGPQTALMAPNAASLTDADIANLAAFIASIGGGAAAPAAAAPAAVPAAAASGSGDVEAGKAKYATCAACHGANGEGAGSFPKLAGQSAADIEGKLKKYRAGEQVGPQTALMAPNAANLSDADIGNLASFIASLGAGGSAAAAPAPAAAAPVEVSEAVLARGKAIYSQCAICHGWEDAPSSRLLNAPLLPGHPATAVKSLMAMYKAGKPVGPNSEYMYPIAQAWSDEDIEAVAAYIGTLKPHR